MRTIIRCTGVSYRQGLMEVSVGIHAEHVNLETWNIAPHLPVPEGPRQLFDRSDVVTGSTEIELSRAQAEALIKALQEALLQLPS